MLNSKLKRPCQWIKWLVKHWCLAVWEQGPRVYEFFSRAYLCTSVQFWIDYFPYYVYRDVGSGIIEIGNSGSKILTGRLVSLSLWEQSPVWNNLECFTTGWWLLWSSIYSSIYLRELDFKYFNATKRSSIKLTEILFQFIFSVH